MGSNISKYTLRLFKKSPDFFSGVASIFACSDGSEIYNFDETEDKADASAISADWKAVGEDLKLSIEEYGRSIKPAR